jgi:hypothetical protein
MYPLTLLLLCVCGTQQIGELLTPVVCDPDVPVEVAGIAALSLGLVFTSSAREDVVMSVLQVRYHLRILSNATWG